jgi:hypothetical protein
MARLPLGEAQAKIKKLEHDKEQLVAACEELFDIDAKHMRLKAHVRKLAWQLLGIPSDYQETPIREMLGLDRPQSKVKEPKKEPVASKRGKPVKAAAPNATGKEKPISKSK